jgi:hypothetical protein
MERSRAGDWRARSPFARAAFAWSVVIGGTRGCRRSARGVESAILRMPHLTEYWTWRTDGPGPECIRQEEGRYEWRAAVRTLLECEDLVVCDGAPESVAVRGERGIAADLLQLASVSDGEHRMLAAMLLTASDEQLLALRRSAGPLADPGAVSAWKAAQIWRDLDPRPALAGLRGTEPRGLTFARVVRALKASATRRP